jgi:hypothetical protein
VYRNDTWKLAEATVIPMEQNLPISFRYIDDNSYKYQPSTNPGYKAFITSPMNIMADMTAAMAEQSFHSGGVQEITPLTPVQMSWWKTFKLVYSSPVWYSFSPVSSPFYDTLEFSRLSSPCAASLARDFIHPAFVADAVKRFWIHRQR